MSDYLGLLFHYQRHMYDRDSIGKKVPDEFEDHRPLGGNGPVLFIPKKDPYNLSPPPALEYTYNFGSNILAKAFYEGSKSPQLHGLEHSWKNLIAIEDEPEKPPRWATRPGSYRRWLERSTRAGIVAGKWSVVCG